MKTINFLYIYIVQKFAVDSEVIVTNPLEIVRKSHTWRTDFPRVLRRLALMIDELDISWDHGISSVFSRHDALLSTICVLIELSFFYNRSGTETSSTYTIMVST